LRYANSLLFSDCGDNSDYSVFEDSAGIKILLGEAPIAHSVCRQSVQVLKSFQHTFSGEAIQRPKQQNVKFSPAGISEHSLKLGTLVRWCSFVVDVLTDHGPGLLR
jgi:hypothetical protein